MSRIALPLIKTLALVCVALLGGCTSFEPVTGAEATAIAEGFSFWSPHLLLTSNARYRKLEVEIDWVEGTKPSRAEVQAITDLLNSECPKPDGIEVRLDNAISRKEAQGKSRRALAELHINGPKDPEAAFAYFLLYDSKLAGAKPSNPIAQRIPYPAAVFVDRRYMRRWTWLPRGRTLARCMMEHETAHLLGLTGNRAHGDGIHCTNRFCLLNPTLEYRPLKLVWFGPVIANRELCADCRADLAANRGQAPAANLRFKGPYCIRSESGYHVVTTPGYVYIHTGELETLDFDALDRRRRERCVESPPSSDGLNFQTAELDLETAQRLLPLLRADPLEGMNAVADALQEKLGSVADTGQESSSTTKTGDKVNKP